MTQESFTFTDIFSQNKKRIHYYIHRLHIRDPHDDYYQAGLTALWNAYESYNPNKGPMGTYFNFMIRNRLIDKIRANERSMGHIAETVKNSKAELTSGNRLCTDSSITPLPEVEKPIDIEQNAAFWHDVKAQLTEKQWAWIHLFVIEEWSQQEIADHYNTTVSAVKGWGRLAREKLQKNHIKQKLLEIKNN